VTPLRVDDWLVTRVVVARRLCEWLGCSSSDSLKVSVTRPLSMLPPGPIVSLEDEESAEPSDVKSLSDTVSLLCPVRVVVAVTPLRVDEVIAVVFTTSVVDCWVVSEELPKSVVASVFPPPKMSPLSLKLALAPATSVVLDLKSRIGKLLIIPASEPEAVLTSTFVSLVV
jgi:hypothetical protein